MQSGSIARVCLVALALLASPALKAEPGAPVAAPETVTVKNFQRAESDMYFGNIVRQVGVGRFMHNRAPTPIEKQDVVRMNRDTLYSAAVLDLDAGPVTVVLPEAGRRFMSMQIVTEDHYSPPTAYAPARVELTRAATGTRYVMVIVRTLANPEDVADLQAANALQDAITVHQPGGPGRFEVPDWDEVSQSEVRKLLSALQERSGATDEVRMGTREEVDPVFHLMATATGWGLNPRRDALYLVRYPKPNDGSTPMELTVRDVPVDGFWSISVYDSKGFFQKNDLGSYSLNNITAKPNPDGSHTIRFGGCTAGSVNCLVTPPGWNYVVRLYRPRAELLSGRWQFPEPQPSR